MRAAWYQNNSLDLHAATPRDIRDWIHEKLHHLLLCIDSFSERNKQALPQGHVRQ
jgi:hypothetical protein